VAKSTRSSNKNSEGQHLITILFILGIIGWGFFAIDRLTEPEQTSSNPKIQTRTQAHESEWKKKLRSWLSTKFSTDKNSTQSQRISLNIPMEREPQNLKRENNGVEDSLTEIKEIPIEKAQIDAPETLETNFSILFYKLDKRGQPTLSTVRRQVQGDALDYRARLSLLIKGPTLNEQDKDYIDSFIRKPRVLGAGVTGTCAYVNFDTSFGSGVSYQTMRFQVQQIFKNMTLWSKKACLELRVQGKYTPHLGSDGIFFPKKIDAAWLKENL